MEIAHADIKPDNFLLRHYPGTYTAPSLQLIDFGKAVDMSLGAVVDDEDEDDESSLEDEDESGLTEEEREEREIERNEREAEKKQKNLFTDVGAVGNYHLDYYGIAGCAYCLLFGQYLDVGTVKNKWIVKGTFQRKWQSRLWMQFFDEMLNPSRSKEKLPSLVKWRERFVSLLRVTEIQEGLVKAREFIEAKTLAKMRRTL